MTAMGEQVGRQLLADSRPMRMATVDPDIDVNIHDHGGSISHDANVRDDRASAYGVRRVPNGDAVRRSGRLRGWVSSLIDSRFHGHKRIELETESRLVSL